MNATLKDFAMDLQGYWRECI